MMVRNDRRTKLLPKIILGQLVVVVIIFALGSTVLFYTQGYRFDFSHFQIIRTGVVYLEILPRDTIVKIDNASYQVNSSIAKNLPPARYTIMVTKSGYVDWNLSLKVASSSVNDFNNILLFKRDIESSTLTDQNKINSINTPTEIMATHGSNGLSFTDYELWIGEKLATRFANPIKNAVWYPDQAHIVYQQGNQIRVIENAGTNDTLLVTLNSDAKSYFAIGNRGTELYYTDGDQYKIAVIR